MWNSYPLRVWQNLPSDIISRLLSLNNCFLNRVKKIIPLITMPPNTRAKRPTLSMISSFFLTLALDSDFLPCSLWFSIFGLVTLEFGESERPAFLSIFFALSFVSTNSLAGIRPLTALSLPEVCLVDSLGSIFGGSLPFSRRYSAASRSSFSFLSTLSLICPTRLSVIPNITAISFNVFPSTKYKSFTSFSLLLNPARGIILSKNSLFSQSKSPLSVNSASRTDSTSSGNISKARALKSCVSVNSESRTASSSS